MRITAAIFLGTLFIAVAVIQLRVDGHGDSDNAGYNELCRRACVIRSALGKADLMESDRAALRAEHEHVKKLLWEITGPVPPSYKPATPSQP
jgi:hypothetical protein